LLPIIVGFSHIYISQGSVATQSRCGGIFSNRFIANCSQSVTVKNFENPLTFGKDMDNIKVGRFLGHSVLHIWMDCDLHNYMYVENFAI